MGAAETMSTASRAAPDTSFDDPAGLENVRPIPRISIQAFCETPGVAATMQAAIAMQRQQHAAGGGSAGGGAAATAGAAAVTAGAAAAAGAAAGAPGGVCAASALPAPRSAASRASMQASK